MHHNRGEIGVNGKEHFLVSANLPRKVTQVKQMERKFQPYENAL